MVFQQGVFRLSLGGGTLHARLACDGGLPLRKRSVATARNKAIDFGNSVGRLRMLWPPNYAGSQPRLLFRPRGPSRGQARSFDSAPTSEGRPWAAAKPFRLTLLRARHHFTELIDLLISAGSDSARFCSALARWVSSRFTLVRGNSPPVPSGVIKQIVLSWTHTAAAR